jgi:glycosyltransferase involved in cell wall biosynthesis
MDVLLDMTPLLTRSRLRGIGHYVVWLARAIDALSEREREGLDIAALVALFGDRAVGDLGWEGPSGEAPMDLIPWLMRRRTLLVPTLARLRPRLFHATHAWGTPRGSGVLRVATCHDLILHELHQDYLPGRWAYRRLLRLVDAGRFHSARRVIAISQYTASSLMRLLRIPARRIDVIPHGVDHDRFRPPASDAERREAEGIRESLGLTRPYLLNLGGADVRKSVDTLVVAFGKAAVDVDLVLVGHHDPGDVARIDRALEQAGSPANVRRLGFVPDAAVPAILTGALALVFPSVAEGFGLPLLEAMASGCPVITTLGTALSEVAGDAALFAPARDAAALADAMRRIVREDNLRNDLRRAGLARAAGYSWRNAALQTVASYHRALRS